MQGLVISGARALSYVEEETRPLHDFEVRVETLLSGISAGVELAAYRGTSPFLTKRYDYQTKLFVSDAPGETYPIGPLGYEEMGVVVEVGKQVAQLQPGNRVCGAWGHRTKWILTQDSAFAGLMPDKVNPVVGCFSFVARIALNAMLDAEVKVGDCVAVFGAGTVGQLVAQMVQLAGGRVILIDPCRLRLDIAGSLGVKTLMDPTGIDVGREIKRITHNRGVDVAFECSGAYAALHEAIRSCAYGATVITMGFYQGSAEGLSLGEEFHHNRVTLCSSQVGGTNPLFKGRWSHARLTREVHRLLLEERSLKVEPMVTHRIPFGQAASAFELLDREPHNALQVLLTIE